MLRAAIDCLSEALPDARFVLLSVYPDDDARENPDPALEIVRFTPKHMVFAAFPLALLFGAARRFDLARSIQLPLPSLREVHDADLVIDLSGISFVDGRGYSILLYNIILALLPGLVGTPVMKYAQAIGPFKNPLNRWSARLCLPKVSRIAARGRITLQHLRELGLPHDLVTQCTDAAFAMRIGPDAERAAQHWLSHPAFTRPVVAVSASSVVHEYCQQRGVTYTSLMAGFIDHLTRERGYGVLLLPHSTRLGKRSHKNNDLPVCDRIKSHLGDNPWVVYPNLAEHADTLRVLIGRCRFLVASRFHAMISGLAMGVPSLLIGWSHKYVEVLEEFELQDFAIDFSEASLDRLKREFARLEAEESGVRDKIAKHLPRVVEASVRNARLALDLLGHPQPEGQQQPTP